MAHPIENITSNTMENLKKMIDVDTVVGNPVQSVDGITILPISRVSFGFVTGGGEYAGTAAASKSAGALPELPFAGGTGAGVSVMPIGFLVVGQGNVKLIPAQHNTPIDRLIELVPQAIADIKELIKNTATEEEPGPIVL